MSGIDKNEFALSIGSFIAKATKANKESLLNGIDFCNAIVTSLNITEDDRQWIRHTKIYLYQRIEQNQLNRVTTG